MKKKKILIIDDEVDFGFLMERFFKPRNFEVIIALTLTEGLRLLEEEKPDVIFLDNNLPDGLGWGETENILLNHPHAQLNLISAVNIPKTSTSSFRILEKPLRLEDLKEMYDPKPA